MQPRSRPPDSVSQGNASANVMQARTLHDGVFMCLRQIGNDLGGFRRSPTAISRPLGDPGPGRPESIGRLDSGNGLRRRRFDLALELAERVLGKLSLGGLFGADR